MKLSEFEIGARLELELYDKIGEKMEPSFVSKFEWAEDEKTAYIAAPIYEGAIYPVHIGTEMNVYLFQKSDLYRFKAKVMSRENKDNIAILKITVYSKIERIQRRQYFRFECSVPIKYRVVNVPDDESNTEAIFSEGVTRDLSGGGACIATDEEIKQNAILQLELQLDEEKFIRFFTKVIRSIKQENVMKFKYRLSLEFTQIENNDREAIIKYIFQQQRKLRKKGLI